MHAFLISNTFISNARLKFKKNIKEMLSNTLRLNFCYLKIIHILHPRYHPKIIGGILQNKQKNKYVCIHEMILLLVIQSRSFARVWNTHFIIFSFHAQDSFPERIFWSQLVINFPEYDNIMGTKCEHWHM